MEKKESKESFVTLKENGERSKSDASLLFQRVTQGVSERLLNLGESMGITSKEQRAEEHANKLFNEVADGGDVTFTDESSNVYSVISNLKSGYFGPVLKIRNNSTLNVYVAKEYNLEKILDRSKNPAGVIEIAQTEIKCMKALQDSPFVMSLDSLLVLQYTKAFWLVSEYVPCGDLANVMKSIGTFNVDQLSCIMAQALLGLKAIHDENIVHGDVKPDNILLTNSGVLKLFDFGASFELNPERKSKISTIPRQAGTINYMAPELFASSVELTMFDKNEIELEAGKELEFGYAIDIWALGCTAIECLTGFPVFPLYEEEHIRKYLHGLKMGTEAAGSVEKKINKANDTYVKKKLKKKTQRKKRFASGKKGMQKNMCLREFIFTKCLTVDPAVRSSTVELMSHSFVTKQIESLEQSLTPNLLSSVSAKLNNM